MSNRSRTVPSSLLLALLLLIPSSLATAQDQGPTDVTLLLQQGACSICSCYWSSDCSDNQYCSYVTCTASGKFDGVCKTSGGGGGVILEDLPLTAGVIEDRFDAFDMSMGSITGETLDEALRIARRAQNHRLTLPEHDAVASLTTNALDVAVGFDLVASNPRLCSASGPVHTFRGHDSPAARELLRAVRTGVVAAVRAGDPSLVEEPLRSFWARYPHFEPDHTGRCYSHGHRDFPYSGPLECQVAELRRALSVYLPKTESQKGYETNP